jgi:hypothetical protein
VEPFISVTNDRALQQTYVETRPMEAVFVSLAESWARLRRLKGELPSSDVNSIQVYLF